MPILQTKVLIVGAGPTGLSLAAQLMRYGIDFIILEKNEKTTALSKALVVQARTLEIFQEIGLADTAIQKGKITTALNLFYKGKKRAEINISGLGEGISQFPYALSLEQSKTEQLLVDYLTSHQKIISWKSELTSFSQNEDSVVAYYDDVNGKEQMIEAAYLVGCDGANSQVRHELRLAFEGDTVPKLFYVADVKLKSPVINKNELFIFLIKKGFTLFFPMEGEGHYRLVGVLPDAKTGDEHFQFSDIENDIKKQIVLPVEFEELRWFSTYKVHSRMANAFMVDRCFIAGDAAHIHTPAGGQGMNTGIQDAYNLAWKLALTINQKTNPSILSTYNTERSENAKHLLQTTDRMFDIMAGESSLGNFIRLYIFPLLAGMITRNSLVKRNIFPLISQTGIAYPNSELTMAGNIGKVKSGDRMHYFNFPNGKCIFDFLIEPSYKILFFGKKGGQNYTRPNNNKIPIVTHEFQEIPASIFGDSSDFYILLRPDNHISYIGKDLNHCMEMLNKFAV